MEVFPVKKLNINFNVRSNDKKSSDFYNSRKFQLQLISQDMPQITSKYAGFTYFNTTNNNNSKGKKICFTDINLDTNAEELIKMQGINSQK